MKQVIDNIVVCGLSHKTAPIGVRECFCNNKQGFSTLRAQIVRAGIPEIVMLATCNRFEIFCAAHEFHETGMRIFKVMSRFFNVDQDIFATYFYTKYGRDAVQHLFSVAASIDSMVIGENEVLSQVKHAYAISVQHKQTGMLLNKLFHQAFRTAKRIKNETNISKIPISVASIAIELLKKEFPAFRACTVLMLGAGEMGQLLLKYLTKECVKKIFIANRSLYKAGSIAASINKNAHVIPLSEVHEGIIHADIIVTSLASPDYPITVPLVRQMMQQRSGKLIMMLDIAVPRNIDPDVKKIKGVFLYNIDDLKDIARENLSNRYQEIDTAKTIINEDTDSFFRFYEGLQFVPLITSIQEKCNQIRQHELRKYRRRKLKHLSPEDFSIVEELTMSIMNKTLHNPIQYIKQFPVQADTQVTEITEKRKIVEDIWINEQSK
jgi:glutamyl-tRNA reductase